MSWLVNGGAGYVGAHVVSAMQAAGHEVIVLDDLSTGIPSRVGGVPFVQGSVLDEDLVRRIIREHQVSGIFHFAARKRVDESVNRPLLYYRQNVEGLRAVLQAASDAGVECFVYSSSASVYGSPNIETVTEDTDCRPVNPYGRTKLIGEQMIADVSAVTGLRYAALRYFNVAGTAEPALADRGSGNLLPLVFERLTQHRPPQIFGADYPTPDGTCIRDFVHVADIASAHVSAAQALASGHARALTANIGRGEGVSVREMVDLIREVTRTSDQSWAEPVVSPPRPGDPARVVASAEHVRDVLGWTAKCGVEEIVASAWEGWCATMSP